MAQVLREAEIIDPLDWILSVKIITYSSPIVSAAGSQVQDAVSGCTTEGDDGEYSEGSLRDYTVKKVHRAVDLPVNRSATLRQLYQAILSAFPHLREIPILPLVKPIVAPTVPPPSANQIISEQIQVVKDESESVEFIEKSLLSIAKGFSSGAPLSLSTSVKSAWDPLALTSSPDLKIDHPSFGFRDGVVLLVRGAADWQRALSQDSSLSQGSEGDGVQKAAPTRPVMKPLGSFKSKSSGGVRMARGDRALSVGDVRISREEPLPLSDKLKIDSTPTFNHESKCFDAGGADIGTGVLSALGSMSLKPDSTMSLTPDSTSMSLKPDSTLVENSTPVAKLLKSSSVPLLLPSVAQQFNDALGPT